MQFEKNSYINRNKIKTSQGDIWLTVPVSTTSHFEKTILEMEIAKDNKWRKKHWKSIESCYNKAPYFQNYRIFFENLYNKEWTNLFDLLYETMMFLFDKIGIKTKIYRQSELGFKKNKQELILEMCDYFNSNVFVFGKLGENYADKYLFDKKKIFYYFQNYQCSNYLQLYGEFIPNLSIIDLIFNVGTDKALEYIMKGNISKEELNKSTMK